jgi:hypothetical protein
MAKTGEQYFLVSGSLIEQYSGASNFNTDALELPNKIFIIYAESTHTIGSPKIDIEFSNDATNWFVYKSQQSLSLPQTIWDDEFLPRYMRLKYAANLSNGNVTFTIVNI